VKPLFFRRGQNLVELALLLGLVGLVLIGMQTYLKRSVQGKVKDLTDAIVSNQQSAIQPGVDVVTSSTSSFALHSTLTSTESTGGGRRFLGDENSSTVYNQTP
jgi:Flp pilus assembly pilin Flp